MFNYNDFFSHEVNNIGTQCVVQLWRICYAWQLKIHGNRRGQAKEPLNKAPSLKKYHTKQSEKKIIECDWICQKANPTYGVLQSLSTS